MVTKNIWVIGVFIYIQKIGTIDDGHSYSRYLQQKE
jgi:hypothetical protein